MSTLSTKYDRSFALIVGINAYEKLNPLLGAVNDASAVTDLLRSRFEFRGENIFVLLDQEATQRNVIDHLEILSQKASPDDRVLFFFAGHGAPRTNVSGVDIGYVATVESELNNWGTYLRIEDITRFSNLIAGKHIFFVFDSCFSGLAITRDRGLNLGVSVARWITDCMTHRARQVLAAGLADQKVGDSTSDGHSIFTSYFLKALSGAATGSEGEIIASQVMAYVVDNVQKDTRSLQKPAHGDILGSEPGGDFVFQYPNLKPFVVPANREGGVNTGILIKSGQKMSFAASGVITYDGGYHFTNPDGMLCTYKGQPLAHPQALIPVVWEHDEAYKTSRIKLGIIGSLIGWVGAYSEERAFLIGSERDIIADCEGYLHLAINDAKTKYGDNQGEYQVTVQVI